jgi:SagB-type dehydrogenase family enzyme
MSTATPGRAPTESLSAWYWRRGVASDDWFIDERDFSAAFPIPPAVKIYPELPLDPLPGDPVADLGDADTVLSRPRGAPVGEPALRLDVGDPASLSTFLWYAFGFSRHHAGPHVAYPYHRTVPSARCRFPTQLYVLLPEAEGRRQGFYYFDALHHALVPVAVGAGPRELHLPSAGDGDEPPLAAFVVTSLFWNTACSYQQYAYRLCTQEAGLALGNLEVVATAHGLPSRRHHYFDPAGLAATLRLLPEEETPFAVLTVAGDDAPVWDGAADAPVARDPLGHRWGGAMDADVTSVLVAVDQSARTTRPTVPAAPGHPVAPAAADPPVPPPDGQADSRTLGNALRTRHSGGETFEPAQRPLDRDALERVLAYARAQDSLAVDGVDVRLLVAVNRVDGLTSGAYAWDPDPDRGDAWRLLREGDVVDAFEDAIKAAPSVRARTAPAVVFVTANHAEAEPTWRDATTHVLSAEAGATTQRLLLAAATEGLAGRVLNAFRPSVFRTLTGVDTHDVGPVFSVFLGRRGPGKEIEFEVVP